MLSPNLPYVETNRQIGLIYNTMAMTKRSATSLPAGSNTHITTNIHTTTHAHQHTHTPTDSHAHTSTLNVLTHTRARAYNIEHYSSRRRDQYGIMRRPRRRHRHFHRCIVLLHCYNLTSPWFIRAQYAFSDARFFFFSTLVVFILWLFLCTTLVHTTYVRVLCYWDSRGCSRNV